MASVTWDSGTGYLPAITLAMSSHFLRTARLDIRSLSLADAPYPEMLMNPMVPRMANIVMTTISSTKVNHKIPLYAGVRLPGISLRLLFSIWG